MPESKDRSIHEVIARLRTDVGHDAFAVVDHWPADLSAVGVAQPHDHRYLVYISTLQEKEGRYAFQLERPAIDQDLPFDADPMVDAATYEELVREVRRHLSR
ncbi:MAG: hypothetical protein KDC08_07910 [Actinobacteria bacterium]|nr:hypothetical protein [Actinomycetota bacterium]